MKRMLSYFTIFLINFIVYAHLHGSELDSTPPAPQSSPADNGQIIAARELPTLRNPSEGEHGSDIGHVSEGSSDNSSEHQERINALRAQSMRVNQPSNKKQRRKVPIPNPWNFNVTLEHLEYAGGILTLISAFALFKRSSNNDSQITRSGMPTDAIAVGYQVGTTALSILGGLGLKGIFCAGGLYGCWKVKRWVHEGCRSDLEKAKDEFEDLLNAHIDEYNQRVAEAAKKDENMCNALDGLVAAIALMNQREARTMALLIKLSQRLPPEQQTIFLRMLTPEEQTLFNSQIGNLTAEQLAQAQPNLITGRPQRLIASEPQTSSTIQLLPAIPASMPNRPAMNSIAPATAQINQILHNVHEITQGVRKDNADTLSRPLPTKVPKPKGCCGGCCSQ